MKFSIKGLMDMGPDPYMRKDSPDRIKYSKECHYPAGIRDREMIDKDEEFPSLDDHSTGVTYRQRIKHRNGGPL